MTEPASYDFDLVVLGAGPAGEKGAVQAAYFGKRVAIVEREREPGGAAVHTGTLPSKTLRESALYLSGYHARELYGVAVTLAPAATVPLLSSRRRAIEAAEARAFRRNFERHGVTLLEGEARFVGPHEIAVASSAGERRISGEFVLVATGSRPHRPPGIDFADSSIHDSDEILTIEALPRSLTVLGGGVIGCEYACMFAALGVEVTLVDARPEILPFLDLEIVGRLKSAMEKLGVHFVQGVAWKEVARRGESIVASLADGRTLESEQLLFAAGRTGRTERLGLETIGLAADARGSLEVDEQYRTALPHVFAAGDVIGFPALASVSMEQGRVAVCHAFGFPYKQAVAATMPYGIYTIPEVSAYGETEESCRQKGIDYVAGRALYADNPRGKITGDLEGITKLVVEVGTRRLLGVHVVGERASELVHIGQSVVHLGGTVDVFIDMVFNYPTLADSYKYAAYDCLAALARRG
jgi:NAD(P) transhydrogenase